MSEDEQLLQLLENMAGWVDAYLPLPDDCARLFELLTLLQTTEDLAEAVSKSPTVEVGPKGKFAGAPASRELYNYIRVGDYHLYWGVRFSPNGKTWQSPDVAVCHESAPQFPLAVIECKHYSNSPLPHQMVMSFIGVLYSLRFSVFGGCMKLSMSTGVGKAGGGYWQIETEREESVCSALMACKSKLVSSISPSEGALLLQDDHDFVVSIRDD